MEDERTSYIDRRKNMEKARKGKEGKGIKESREGPYSVSA